eukprot:m.408878 g.408878  ORF g.408878 m.408878 type:complete len:362 (-) comp20150_c5_seq3:736-1821(-)
MATLAETETKGEAATVFDVPEVTVPHDDEGYVQAFRPDQDADIKQFFREYGFVVVRDAVDMADIELVEKDIRGRALIPSRKELSDLTCEELEAIKWPSVYGSKYNTGKGFVGFEPAVSQGAFNVRQSPGLHRVFSNLLGTKALWAKFDRYGLMRPTKGIKCDKPGKTKDHPDWATETGFVHWDQNPWFEPNFARVQGVLAITEHTLTSGGFHCIPLFCVGFHRVYEEYAEAYRQHEHSGSLVNLPDQGHKRFAQRIPMRKGSFVIWDSRLPHGNWPNEDDSFRMVLYLTMFPAPVKDERSTGLRRCEYEDFVEKRILTPLGSKILGVLPCTSRCKTLTSGIRGFFRLETPSGRMRGQRPCV